MSLSSARCTAYSYPYSQQDVLHIHVLTLSMMSCIFMSLPSTRCPEYSCPYRQQDVLHIHVLTFSKMSCIFRSLPSAWRPAYSCPYLQQDVLHIHVLTASKMYCIFLSVPSARCPAYSYPYSQQDVLHTHVLTVGRMSCIFMSLPSTICPAYTCPYRQQDVLHIQSEHLFVCLLVCSFGFLLLFVSFFLSLKQNVRLHVWWSLRCPRQRTCSLRNPYPQQDVVHIQSEHLFVCLLLLSFGDVVAVCFFPSFFLFFSFFLCSFFLSSFFFSLFFFFFFAIFFVQSKNVRLHVLWSLRCPRQRTCSAVTTKHAPWLHGNRRRDKEFCLN